MTRPEDVRLTSTAGKHPGVGPEPITPAEPDVILGLFACCCCCLRPLRSRRPSFCSCSLRHSEGGKHHHRLQDGVHSLSGVKTAHAETRKPGATMSRRRGFHSCRPRFSEPLCTALLQAPTHVQIPYANCRARNVHSRSAQKKLSGNTATGPSTGTTCFLPAVSTRPGARTKPTQAREASTGSTPSPPRDWGGTTAGAAPYCELLGTVACFPLLSSRHPQKQSATSTVVSSCRSRPNPEQ